jgi:hypothetical protein
MIKMFPKIFRQKFKDKNVSENFSSEIKVCIRMCSKTFRPKSKDKNLSENFSSKFQV